MASGTMNSPARTGESTEAFMSAGEPSGRPAACRARQRQTAEEQCKRTGFRGGGRVIDDWRDDDVVQPNELVRGCLLGVIIDPAQADVGAVSHRRCEGEGVAH